MIGVEHELGQMLREANVLSAEDLERAVDGGSSGGESVAQVIRKDASWSNLRQLLTMQIGPRGDNALDLQDVLERAGWISARQLGLVLETIEQCGNGGGELLVEAGIVRQELLDEALDECRGSGRSCWKFLVDRGAVEVRQIAECLNIEDRILARLLVDRDLLEGEVVGDYLKRAAADPASMARLLVDDGVLDGDVVAHCLSELYDVPCHDISAVSPSRELLTLFKWNDLAEYLLLPIERHGAVLTVAMGNPAHISELRDLLADSEMRLSPVIASIPQIADKIGEIREQHLGDEGQPASLKELAGIDPQGTPAEIVDAVIREASSNRGTDVHFDPGWDRFLVRVRIDGKLHELLSATPSAGIQIVSRLKSMASLDIADQLHPHDGHLATRVGSSMLDMRISTVPTKYGEKVVLRLIHDLQVVSDFTGLGMSDEQSETVNDLLRNPSGLLLCSGPVGSGRTTTLYCALNKLNVPEKNVITLEDPVEYSLTRVNQIEVAERLDFNFSDGLRAIGRHDPDVLMLSEIRDAESAAVAVKAAMSGVSVLSSLPSDDAAGVIDILRSLGISPYLIAGSLTGTISQRLVRRLCEACSEPYEADPALATELGLATENGQALTLRRPRGCGECLGSGYRGRIGIFEVMRVTEEIRGQILGGADRKALREVAVRDGMSLLTDQAARTIVSGLTTPEEFLKHGLG